MAEVISMWPSPEPTSAIGLILARMPHLARSGPAEWGGVCPCDHHDTTDAVWGVLTLEGSGPEWFCARECGTGTLWAELWPEQAAKALAEPAASTMLGLRPVADLLAEVLPPIDWLVAPYLEAGGSMAALVAPPNLGKTLLAMWLTTQVAASGRRVAVIELEGGKRGLQKRLSRAIEACGGIGRCGSIDYAFKPRLSLMSTPDIDAMCIELRGYSLIIIDSLACATAGLAENEVVAMSLVVSALQRISVDTGATILIIHHTGKTKWKPGGDAPSIGDGRGSGVLDAALDTVLALAPLTEADQVRGSVSFGLYCTKQRDEEKAEPQLVRVLMTGAAAVLTMEPKTDGGSARVDGKALDVMAALTKAGEEGASKKWIEDEAGGNRERVRAILGELKARGEAEELPWGQYTKWRRSTPRPTSPQASAGDPSPTSPPYEVGARARASVDAGDQARRGQRNWNEREDT